MTDQIVFIHGGETFDSREAYYDFLRKLEYRPFEQKKRWRDWIAWGLSDKYEMLAPSMPNKLYADYESWRIWFEKAFPYLKDGKLVLIGHSLGTLFLAKYLSENKFPRRIDQLHLVAPVFDNEGLTDETIGDFKLDPDRLSNLESQAEHICIYSSRDDKVVPFSHGDRYHARMPKSKFFAFEDRGHFDQPALPELLENILKLDVA